MTLINKKELYTPTGKYLTYYLKNKDKPQTMRKFKYMCSKYGGVTCYRGVYIPPSWAYDD